MPDARGLRAGLHLHVHQEVLEELLRRVDVRRRRRRAHLVEDVGDQGVALQGAHLVVDRLQYVQPVIRVVAGPQGGLQVAHGGGVRLVGGGLDQRRRRHAQLLDPRIGGVDLAEGCQVRQVGGGLAEPRQQGVQRGGIPAGEREEQAAGRLGRPGRVLEDGQQPLLVPRCQLRLDPGEVQQRQADLEQRRGGGLVRAAGNGQAVEPALPADLVVGVGRQVGGLRRRQPQRRGQGRCLQEADIDRAQVVGQGRRVEVAGGDDLPAPPRRLPADSKRSPILNREREGVERPGPQLDRRAVAPQVAAVQQRHRRPAQGQRYGGTGVGLDLQVVVAVFRRLQIAAPAAGDGVGGQPRRFHGRQVIEGGAGAVAHRVADRHRIEHGGGEGDVGLGRRSDHLQRLLVLAAALQVGQQCGQQVRAPLCLRGGGGHIGGVVCQQLRIAVKEPPALLVQLVHGVLECLRHPAHALEAVAGGVGHYPGGVGEPLAQVVVGDAPRRRVQNRLLQGGLSVGVCDIGDDGPAQQTEEAVGRLVAVDQRQPRPGNLAVRVVGQGELALDGGEIPAQAAGKTGNRGLVRRRPAADVLVPEQVQRLHRLQRYGAQAAEQVEQAQHGWGGRVGGGEGVQAAERGEQEKLPHAELQLARQPAPPEDRTDRIQVQRGVGIVAQRRGDRAKLLVGELKGRPQGLRMGQQFRRAAEDMAEAVVGEGPVLRLQRRAEEHLPVERGGALGIDRGEAGQQGLQVLFHLQLEPVHHPPEHAEARQQGEEARIQPGQVGRLIRLVGGLLRRVERRDRLVGLLDAPAQLAPESDEAVKADKVEGAEPVGAAVGVGVAELQRVEAAQVAGAAGVGQGQPGVGVDETRLEDLDDLLVGERQPAREGPGVGQFAQYLVLRGRRRVAVELLQRDGAVGQQGVLGAGETQLFH